MSGRWGGGEFVGGGLREDQSPGTRPPHAVRRLPAVSLSSRTVEKTKNMIQEQKSPPAPNVLSPKTFVWHVGEPVAAVI